MYQGGSDALLGPCDPILAPTRLGHRLRGRGRGDHRRRAHGRHDGRGGRRHIRLFMLVNDVSLRNLIPGELGKGFGFFQASRRPPSRRSRSPRTSWATAWDGRKLHLPLLSHLNGELFGRPDAGVDMTFDFPQLIAHAAKTRPLGAGTIVGSGTVSNKDRSRRLLLSGRAAARSRPSNGASPDALHELRRPDPDRDAGRRRPEHLRGH